MAKFEKGILGHFNGKVGTVVGSTWRGVSYMKSKPTKGNRIPSQKQKEQQDKFRLISRFIKALLVLLRQSFSNGGNMSAVNHAFSYNIMHAIMGVYPTYSLDYSKVLVSDGSLVPVTGAAAVASGNGGVKFNWTPNSGLGAGDTDRFIGVVYCPELNQAVYTTNGAATRITGTADIDATLFAGKTVETWGFFISDYATAASVYTGQLVVS